MKKCKECPGVKTKLKDILDCEPIAFIVLTLPKQSKRAKAKEEEDIDGLPEKIAAKAKIEDLARERLMKKQSELSKLLQKYI